MGPAALLCVASALPAMASSALDNDSIRTAVAAWLADPTAAEATYGHISTWDTADVVDMEKLFHFSTDFNEDIGAWNTSSVTSMNRMFWYAIDFDQPIGVFAASDSSAPPGAEPAQAPGTSARSRTLSACSATRRCSTKTSVFCGVLPFGPFLFSDFITPSPQSDFRHLYTIDAILLQQGHWRVTSMPSPR